MESALLRNVPGDMQIPVLFWREEMRCFCTHIRTHQSAQQHFKHVQIVDIKSAAWSSLLCGCMDSARLVLDSRSSSIIPHSRSWRDSRWSIIQARCYNYCPRKWINTPYKLHSPTQTETLLYSLEQFVICLIARTYNSNTATIKSDERQALLLPSFDSHSHEFHSTIKTSPYAMWYKVWNVTFRWNTANQGARTSVQFRCWQEYLTFKPNTFRNHSNALQREPAEKITEHYEMRWKWRSDFTHKLITIS